MNSMPFSFGKLQSGVKFLLIAFTGVYVAQQFFPGVLEANLGLIPTKVVAGFQLWRLVTYIFLHGSLMHLLFNLFSLWMFGKEIEYAWGTREFLKFFFVCGLGAGIFNVVFEPFSVMAVIGASGSLYGLLVAFAIVYPESVIYLYGIIPMQARHFVILMGLIEFMASFHGTPTVIARFAHLGGFITGYLYLKSYEFRSLMNRSYQKVADSLVVSKKPVKKMRRLTEQDLLKEVDRILEKVLTHGADSLTDTEKETMRRYSTRKH